MPTADYAELEAYDRVIGMPDHNAYQAHIVQYLSGVTRSRLEDFILVPHAATRPSDRLTADESAGILGRHAGGGAINA